MRRCLPIYYLVLLLSPTIAAPRAGADDALEKGAALLLGEVIPMRPPPSPAATISRRLAPAAAMAPATSPAVAPAKAAPGAKEATSPPRTPGSPPAAAAPQQHRATVKGRLEGGGLILLQCESSEGELWIGVSGTAARPGDTIAYGAATSIAPFTSDALHKTFSSVTFPEDVTVTPRRADKGE